MIEATIDKIILKSKDFSFNPKTGSDNGFLWQWNNSGAMFNGVINEGEKRYWLNDYEFNLDVSNDRQGIESLKINFNPNRIDILRLQGLLTNSGLGVNLMNAKVLRSDFERTIKLNYSQMAYHPLLKGMKLNESIRERTEGNINNKSLYLGTTARQLCCYDKSIEQSRKGNILESNLVRIETRLLKPKENLKYGINTLKQLLQYDINELYVASLGAIINPLKLSDDVIIQLSDNYSKYESMIEQFGTKGNKYFWHNLGLENIGLDVANLYASSLNLTRQQKYYIKKQNRNMAKLMNKPDESMVFELMKYFKIA